MDDQNAGPRRPAENLIRRPPTEADLVDLCRALNQRGAKYMVIGGLAIIAAGLPRIMKAITHRAKDAGDLVFLRQWFREQGQEPPPG
jgi:hypothetical protein